MNKILFQGFEWYLTQEDHLWDFYVQEAKALRDIGIGMVWLPPAYKGSSGLNDTGYGVYDNYDLGEFDQKGTVATKYGTKDQYLRAIKALQEQGIDVIADIVLNHKMGADETEQVEATRVNDDNRLEQENSLTIEAWTKFNYASRNNSYSPFKWNYTHFTGTDYDNKTKEAGIFLFKDKQWDGDVDREKFNYDYLMGADVDYNNPDVIDETLRWGQWYIDTTQVNGLRLDAVKHIQFGFFKHWLSKLRESRDLFVVGEYWSDDLRAIHNYLNQESYSMSLFDVPLHFNLYRASSSNGEFDMSMIFEGTLVGNNPNYAVTFVDNHDSQPAQSLESWIEPWFKPMAYALILLRQEGTPCIFYGDYYGIPHNQIAPVREINTLLLLRKHNMFGQKYDYFDDPDIVGWSFTGDLEHPNSGFALVMSNRGAGEKRIFVGIENANKTYVDCLSNHPEPVIIDEDGNGTFSVNAGSISIYVKL